MIKFTIKKNGKSWKTSSSDGINWKPAKGIPDNFFQLLRTIGENTRIPVSIYPPEVARGKNIESSLKKMGFDVKSEYPKPKLKPSKEFIV